MRTTVELTEEEMDFLNKMIKASNNFGLKEFTMDRAIHECIAVARTTFEGFDLDHFLRD